tara:strand:- start:1627 stop:1881 length:255 start_codon:yes stop_codon:yes gene_type:complete
MASEEMFVNLCNDVKYIKKELKYTKEIIVDMKVNTDKMSAHIDFVENHIRWVTKIANFFLPKFKKSSYTNDNEDEFFNHFNKIM